MIISSAVGLFGPYERVHEMGDRLRVWPLGAPADHPGSDLPFAVIGEYQLHDMAVPDHIVAGEYDLVDGALVHKQPVVDATPPVLEEPEPATSELSALRRFFSKS